MITGTRALKELGEVWTAKPEEIVPAVILQITGIFRVNQLSRRREKNRKLWPLHDVCPSP